MTPSCPPVFMTARMRTSMITVPTSGSSWRCEEGLGQCRGARVLLCGLFKGIDFAAPRMDTQLERGRDAGASGLHVVTEASLVCLPRLCADMS